MTQLALLDEVERGGDNELWPTDPHTADLMVRWSGCTRDDLILEPSAGEGALVAAVRRAFPCAGPFVEAVEFNAVHAAALLELANLVTIGDWSKVGAQWELDRKPQTTLTLTNPPFSLIRSHLPLAVRRSLRTTALLPLYALENRKRYDQVWSMVEIPRLAVFRSRPPFGGEHKPSIAYCLADIRAVRPGAVPDRTTRLDWL